MTQQQKCGIGALLLAAACGCGGGPSNPQLAVGGPTPPFHLASVVDGRMVDSDALKGHVAVVHFWSTSCTICLEEIDALKEIHRSGEARIVSIALDDDAQRVHNVIRQRGIEYPVLLGNQ